MLRSSVAVFLLSLVAAFSASAAQRTFVSTSGNDANTASHCSNTVPCRGFAAALTVTDSGGEIIVQDSGGYGPVTIDKSVNVIAPEGVYAGISVFSGDGITIATPGIHVVLRGLNINRIGGTGNGINMSAGNSLVVQNCVITNFSGGSGLLVSSDALVRVLDSLLRGNSYGARFLAGKSALVSGSRLLENATHGIAVEADVTPIGTVVTRSEASGNGHSGVFLTATSQGVIDFALTDSVVAKNSFGLTMVDSAGSKVIASASNNLISDNLSHGVTGLSASNEARLIISGNKITHNAHGIYNTGSGVVQSTGDNTVAGNSNPNVGAITSLTNI